MLLLCNNLFGGARYMKRKENILLVILLFSVVVLAGLLFFQVMKGNRKQPEEIEETEQVQESAQEASLEEESPNTETHTGTTEEETESGSETMEKEKEGYIIIGDSHAVVTDGQGYAVHGSDVDGVVYNQNLFIVHTSLDPVMGTFDWLKGDGTERIKTIMKEHPEIAGWNIISIHGTSMVTMPGIVEQYIDNYKIWMNETFKDSKVYIVSVPPLDEKEWVVRHPDLPPRHNQDIIDFNTKIKEAFPDQYFDYYDWFLAHDTFQDEIHYTGETYRTMFDEIMTNIQNK